MPDPLKEKQIILGVCGGIAAYKAADFLRLLVKSGATVRVIMSEAAQAFVGPLTFEALSGHPVWTQLFDGQDKDSRPFGHIQWASQADAVVIIPATANTIGKMAHGIADNALTTFILAVKAPVLVCPSMNVNMYENPLVQDNIQRLVKAGMQIVGPDTGALACGDEGTGRLADISAVAEHLRRVLSPQDLAGERVLVTAGPTQEPMDPVRFISNPSSGKMGYAVARAARRRGAKVLLISGPAALADPEGVTVIRVKTAEEMFNAVMAHVDEMSAVVKAAAVSDWRPARVSEEKVKKNKIEPHLSLEQTRDILRALGENKKDRVVVGFAAETQDLEKNAQAKLAEKNADMIVANLVGPSNSGFGSNTNRARLFFRDGSAEELPVMDKAALADIVLDRILEVRQHR